MNVNHIYFNGADVPRRTFDPDLGIDYSIKDGVITAYCDGYTRKLTPKYGEIYSIIINQYEELEIKRGLPPQTPAKILMWAFGFEGSARVRQHGAFEARCREALENGSAKHQYRLTGDNCGLAYSYHEDSNCASTITPLVAYIDAGFTVDADFVKRFLMDVSQARLSVSLQYPEPYLRKLFRRVFQISKADWQEIVTACPNLFPPLPA